MTKPAATAARTPASRRTGSAPAADAPLPDNYEAARDELVTVVTRLEEGGLSLDDSLTLWERGQALADACEAFLGRARERVAAALAGPEEAGRADDGKTGAGAKIADDASTD